MGGIADDVSVAAGREEFELVFSEPDQKTCSFGGCEWAEESEKRKRDEKDDPDEEEEEVAFGDNGEEEEEGPEKEPLRSKVLIESGASTLQERNTPSFPAERIV